MAQKVNVVLVDDLDGGAAAETVTFGLDGVTYEIDLSARNAKGLRDALGRYIEHGRRVGGGRRRTGSQGRAGRRGAGPDPAEVRAWARRKGIAVSERGRISGEVMAKYEAAKS